MSHEYGCKISSRVHRIDQLAHRICKSRDRSEALTWRRDLRKALAELTQRVDEHCEYLGSGSVSASQNPGPVQEPGDLASLLNEVSRNFSERALAQALLTALAHVETGQVSPNVLDEWFTGVDRQLSESSSPDELSDEAQELIFEGEHFHHFGDPRGPDPEYLRRLANTILGREHQSGAVSVTAKLTHYHLAGQEAAAAPSQAGGERR